MSELDKFSEKEVDQMLEQFSESSTEDVDKFALRELLHSKGDDIRFKSEVSIEQIKAIVKLSVTDKIIQIQAKYSNDTEKAQKLMQSVVSETIQTLLQLMVSHKRLGRSEFISAHIGKDQEEMKRGFFSRWFNTGGGH